MAAIEQMHFDTADWEECFETWKEKLPSYGENMQLVISTHPYTSGYWIEPLGYKVDETEKVYLGDEVLELEKRIQAEFDQADMECRTRHFIF